MYARIGEASGQQQKPEMTAETTPPTIRRKHILS